ncbi:phosphatase PAP2 family protein [Photobacterium carnosum]|uniref:phosphatase PAP2 family protein n=1 Tax=Photobacterium carnosum TaxID=2023717 RepID=UPI001E3478A2|nr:phosphatase PAP2 family protein [Photobacterium carnosum]MCD9522607.1 phosphatase PAP2 family protein [Photobacterium carnosum]MCD9530521.1 phosphatase PAP2 family protein [Photobacterium carnosum]MCD9552039.1 phosphatase PAP2 family protein [Photobacterium carnosum]MCF2154218.1 phosphatase PAP2 family protein [Photobacterium carnosum]MCF2216006.1 phosphatase PAP2 family protein [Photobacterium carnosum]
MITFISKKLPNFIALGLFAILLFIAIHIFPVPVLTTPVSSAAGITFALLTDSAGSPFFLITSALLCLTPVFMRLPKKTITKVWIQFGILLVLSFVTKTVLKHETAIPRPYTYELQHLHLVDSPTAFYALDSAAKDNIVKEASAYVSPWRLRSWEGETNYSFPSGHTIFAAICVLFWGGFFIRQGKYLIAGGLIIWAIGVGISRLWLGMHFPSDVMGSILSAAVLYFFVPEWDENTKKNRK